MVSEKFSKSHKCTIGDRHPAIADEVIACGAGGRKWHLAAEPDVRCHGSY